MGDKKWKKTDNGYDLTDANISKYLKLDDTKESGVSLTSTQKNELCTFLSDFLQTYKTDYSDDSALPILPDGHEEYNYKNASDSPLLACLLYYGIYSVFVGEHSFFSDNPGERKEVWNPDTEGSDPEGRFANKYTRTKASTVDFVAKNLFNCSDDDIEKMRFTGKNNFNKKLKDYSAEELLRFYYSNGYYYCASTSGIGGPCTLEVTVSNVEYKNGYYLVTYNWEISEGEDKSGTTENYALLKYIKIDGKNYWSLYKNSKKQNHRTYCTCG